MKIKGKKSARIEALEAELVRARSEVSALEAQGTHFAAGLENIGRSLGLGPGKRIDLRTVSDAALGWEHRRMEELGTLRREANERMSSDAARAQEQRRLNTLLTRDRDSLAKALNEARDEIARLSVTSCSLCGWQARPRCECQDVASAESLASLRSTGSHHRPMPADAGERGGALMDGEVARYNASQASAVVPVGPQESLPTLVNRSAELEKRLREVQAELSQARRASRDLAAEVLCPDARKGPSRAPYAAVARAVRAMTRDGDNPDMSFLSYYDEQAAALDAELENYRQHYVSKTAYEAVLGELRARSSRKRMTRQELHELAIQQTWHGSKTDFVTDVLHAAGIPDVFVVSRPQRMTRQELQEIAEKQTWRGSKAEFVDDVLDAAGIPGFFVVEHEAPAEAAAAPAEATKPPEDRCAVCKGRGALGTVKGVRVCGSPQCVREVTRRAPVGTGVEPQAPLEGEAIDRLERDARRALDDASLCELVPQNAISLVVETRAWRALAHEYAEAWKAHAADGDDDDDITRRYEAAREALVESAARGGK